MKEGQVSTSISGTVLSIHVQKLGNDLHVDNPSDFVAYRDWLHDIQCCME